MQDGQAVPIPSLGMECGSVTKEVLAVVSHDLRNPLNVIAAGTDLLDGGGQSDEERTEILRMIKRAADRMERLIVDLLEVTRLDGGRTLTVEPQRIDVVPLLEEVRDAFAAAARRSGRQLECRLPEGLPAVYADHDRIHQVLANLISNALKFTPCGGTITLEAAWAGDQVRCSVQDTGPGMNEEEMDRLFEPFWQAARTARLGFGLGLKIAKSIVEAHGGTMFVDSRLDEGSTFSFTLPVAADRAR
jgi:signal transduction histidine kinase